jgi:glycosyltransferase involved in cell wall biosynthesis
MIEAMACGTPVIAWRKGSVPEVVEEGATGFVVDSMDEATAAFRRLERLDRAGCRKAFEDRYTVSRMARKYVQEYERLQGQELADFHTGARVLK